MRRVVAMRLDTRRNNLNNEADHEHILRWPGENFWIDLFESVGLA
jgi:hypothetical protein